VAGALAAPAAAAPGRPRLRVADVFRAHGEAYQQTHAVTAPERAVIRAIVACRTAVLGGHLEICPQCDLQRPVYNSCRNRHCPSCQAMKQAAWIAARQERVLPTRYFHLVFTLPGRLRPLALRNRARVFDLLCAAASQTLLALGRDPKRLGATLAITSVLHTWTRQLDFHPHLHCIVAGGGLSLDRTRWVDAQPGYLFPVKVLSALFRGKFLAALTAAYDQGQLDLGGTCAPLADRDTFAAVDQFTCAVRSCVEPSLKVPVAVICCVCRRVNVTVAGVTVIAVRAAEVTVSSVLSVLPPSEAEIIVLPSATPVAIPRCVKALEMVATAAFDDVHVAVPVTSAVDPSL
jgi:hypothetical protein